MDLNQLLQQFAELLRRPPVTWWDVLEVVKEGGYLADAQVSEVEKFLRAPAQWSAAHGGVSSFPSG